MTDRGDVRCHSVMRRVISAFVAIPSVYVQTAGPNGVTHVATRDRARTVTSRRTMGRRARASSASATPTAAGPRKKLPWRFAHARTRSGIAHVTAGTGHARRGSPRPSRTARCRPAGARSPREAIPTTKPARARSAAGRGASQRRAPSIVMATAATTRATRSTTRPHQPSGPLTAAKSTPVPHCWLSDGSRGREGEGIGRRTAMEPSISSPARTWYGEIHRGHRGDGRRQRGQEDRRGRAKDGRATSTGSAVCDGDRDHEPGLPRGSASRRSTSGECQASAGAPRCGARCHGPGRRVLSGRWVGGRAAGAIPREWCPRQPAGQSIGTSPRE